MDRDQEGNKGKTCLSEDSAAAGNQSANNCSLSKDYLTADEEEVLSKIRALWKESRKIKSRLKELDSAINRVRNEQCQSDDREAYISCRGNREPILREWRQCIQRLEELRTEREILEQARKEANRIKMILLGHLD